ncbi:MAG TPA: UrcA family protein [Caulobacteraceae bacterium]|jgi:UrcA family protein|nr:UrcA family protein [Caulobacteraceae bacterium]
MSLAPVSRAIALAATLSALALPAAAQSVKVNVAGLDAKTAHTQIVKAAQAVCSSANAAETLRYYTMGDCIDDTVAATEAKVAALGHRYASVQNGR